MSDSGDFKVNINVPTLKKHIKQDLEILTEKAKKRISTPTSKEEQDKQELIALRRSVESQNAIIKALRHNAMVMKVKLEEVELQGAKIAFKHVYDIPITTITELLCESWQKFETEMLKVFVRDRKPMV